MAEEVRVSIDKAEPENEEAFIGVAEAARIAGRCQNTVRNWIYAGDLKAQKVGKNGRFRIKKSDLEAALTYDPRCRKDEQ